MEEQIKQQQHTKPANAMDKKSSFSYIVDETLDECRFGFTREKKKGRTESQNVRGKKKREEENDVSDDSVRSKINTNSIFAPPPSPPSSFRLLPL